MPHIKPIFILLLLTLNLTANIRGNHSFTVTDFNLQVGRLPVQVNRTYSTLQRNSELDFGYGWSIDYQNVKLQENTHPARDWKITPDTLIGSCFKFDTSHQVAIFLPDGTRF